MCTVEIHLQNTILFKALHKFTLMVYLSYFCQVGHSKNTWAARASKTAAAHGEEKGHCSGDQAWGVLLLSWSREWYDPSTLTFLYMLFCFTKSYEQVMQFLLLFCLLYLIYSGVYWSHTPSACRGLWSAFAKFACTVRLVYPL